jgi:hypothetical protein
MALHRFIQRLWLRVSLRTLLLLVLVPSMHFCGCGLLEPTTSQRMT